MIDVEASLAATHRQHAEGAVKVAEDLDRYRAVIAATKPEIVVECGTFDGGSAKWFEAQGLEVVTIDVNVVSGATMEHSEQITWAVGDSTADRTVGLVAALVHGRRTMVVLDSSHHAHHVAQEITAYGPLVTPGCYLVVEDGIVRWMPESEALGGGPLVAIEKLLVGNPDWELDEEIEAMHRVSMYPMGWWRRAS